MSKKILLIHSSVDGHTVKILDKISSLIGEKRNVTKKCISEVSKDLIKESDSVVIGASIRSQERKIRTPQTQILTLQNFYVNLSGDQKKLRYLRAELIIQNTMPSIST